MEKEKKDQEIQLIKLERETKMKEFEEFKENKDGAIKMLLEDFSDIINKSKEKDSVIFYLKEENDALKERVEILERKNEECQSNSDKESDEKELKSIEEEFCDLDLKSKDDIDLKKLTREQKFFLTSKLKKWNLKENSII